VGDCQRLDNGSYRLCGLMVCGPGHPVDFRVSENGVAKLLCRWEESPRTELQLASFGMMSDGL
jgi:hypothetical protein